MGGVLYIDIDIQTQRNTLGGDGAYELNHIGGGNIAAGDVFYVYSSHLHVVDTLEGVLAIEQISKTGEVVGQIVKERARAKK